MSDNRKQFNSRSLDRLVSVGMSFPWIEIVAASWSVGRKLFQGLAHEGMYEVLEYQSTLELKDNRGERALFRKTEKVRYLQNNINAFQDQAWGDGEVLQNYRCSPGVAVDFHRPGHKTHILIALHEVKNRGDLDEFNIDWGIRNGFLRETELWETDISHRTKLVKTQVVFPKGRPPKRVVLIEDTRKRTRPLSQENQRRLPDGRWLVSWETNKPRLYERYILKWDW